MGKLPSISVRLTNLGAEIGFDDGTERKPLEPSKDADQKNPRRSYVYAHLDLTGNIFYVGKGIRRRAWVTERRHPLWSRYVENHLNGDFTVQILQDNLSDQEAEEIEADWIAQCGESLVNWVNVGRNTDLAAIERFHKLRDANRDLIQRAKKEVEKVDLEKAAQLYVEAIESIRSYAFTQFETGLVGRLLAEENEELGWRGEIEALDRLTMCLVKLGRPEEAAQRTDSYFTLYRRDLQLAASSRITKRVAKALRRVK